jgi:hypothetical protein
LSGRGMLDLTYEKTPNSKARVILVVAGKLARMVLFNWRGVDFYFIFFTLYVPCENKSTNF